MCVQLDKDISELSLELCETRDKTDKTGSGTGSMHSSTLNQCETFVQRELPLHSTNLSIKRREEGECVHS
jgi:hypothetical protein